jgi:hypothetical protein
MCLRGQLVGLNALQVNPQQRHQRLRDRFKEDKPVTNTGTRKYQHLSRMWRLCNIGFMLNPETDS